MTETTNKPSTCSVKSKVILPKDLYSPEKTIQIVMSNSLPLRVKI